MSTGDIAVGDIPIGDSGSGSTTQYAQGFVDFVNCGRVDTVCDAPLMAGSVDCDIQKMTVDL